MGTKSDANYDIDRAAVHHVEGILTGQDWDLSQLVPDRLGIDRRGVLRGEDRQPTHSFYLQIKGMGPQTRKGKAVPIVGPGGFVGKEMEIEHLDSYFRLPVPVFLVVIDVEKKVGYWVFLQRYIRERLGDRDWRLPLREYREGKRKTSPELTIRLPATNRLSDSDELKVAIGNACGYMASLGIDHGIAYEEDALRGVDPRFDVNLMVSKGRRHFHIQAKEPVSLSLNFDMKEEKLDDLMGRGLPITILPGEAKIEGSPLFQRILDDVTANNGQFQFKREFDGHVKLTRLDASGTEVGRLDVVPCRFNGGTDELRFTARAPHDLLTLTGRFLRRSDEPEAFFLTTNIGAWYGRPLLTLPFFDQMKGLFSGMRAGDRLAVEFFMTGGRFCSVTPNERSRFDFADVGAFYDMLGKAREIAELHAMNPTTPGRFSGGCLEEIDLLYELLKGREVRRPGRSGTWTLRMGNEPGAEVVDVFSSSDQPGDLSWQSDVEMPFLGETVMVRGVTNTVTCLRLITGLSVVTDPQSESNGDIALRLAETPETVRTMRGPSGGMQAANPREQALTEC